MSKTPGPWVLVKSTQQVRLSESTQTTVRQSVPTSEDFRTDLDVQSEGHSERTDDSVPGEVS